MFLDKASEKEEFLELFEIFQFRKHTRNAIAQIKWV